MELEKDLNVDGDTDLKDARVDKLMIQTTVSGTISGGSSPSPRQLQLAGDEEARHYKMPDGEEVPITGEQEHPNPDIHVTDYTGN